MKTYARVGAIFCALFLLVIMVGCAKTSESDIDITITSIEVNPATIPQNIDITAFRLEDIQLIITYSDDTIEYVFVNSSMISGADLIKLNNMGTHQITINHLGHMIPMTIQLTNHAIIQLLTACYSYATEMQGFMGSFDDWLSALTSNHTHSIINVYRNDHNEVIVTLSNQQSINLGQIEIIIFRVDFFGFEGEHLATVHVPKGGYATAPMVPTVYEHVFDGWDADFNNVQSDLIVNATFRYVATPIDSIKDADALLISLNRLENAQFMINYDAIFASTTNEQPVKNSRPVSSLLGFSTRLNTYDPYDPAHYISHTYWTDDKFHKSMYEMPQVIDGYHVITTTLTSFNTHALNNLYDVTGQVTQHAKDRADWAVDNLTIADTWIISDWGGNGENRYLLHYNDALDRVELYTVWTYTPHAVTSYEKIYVYYNDQGEEVIESWVFQIYDDPNTPGYPGVISYHNTVAGRDFNYYAIWLNEDYEATMHRHFRGVNLSSEGYYEYYDNNMHMISGDYGWYTIQPVINYNNETMGYPEKPFVTVYSPDANSNVMTIFPNFDGTSYSVQLYLPSMHGVEALLIRDGDMIKVNQDPPYAQEFMLKDGYQLMPDRWEMDTSDANVVSGFRTSKGTYIGSKGILTGDVTLQYLFVNIGREGIRTYSNYFNYYGVASLNVQATSIEMLVERLTQYFDDIGLTYKFGHTAGMFSELGEIYEHYEYLGRKVTFLNEFMKGPYPVYASFDALIKAHEFVGDHLFIRPAIMDMMANMPSMPYDQLPPKAALESVTFINTEETVSGMLSYHEDDINTSNINATLKRSPLLQRDSSYSLYYALLVGGRLIVLAHETPQIFKGQELNFDGNLVFRLPEDISFGTYQTVMFFAKVTDQGFLRISDVALCPFEAFEDQLIDTLDDTTETARRVHITHHETHMFITVGSFDGFAPKITIKGQETYQQEEGVINELILPMGATVSDFIEMVFIVDNVDGEIIFDLMHLTKDGNPVHLFDAMLGQGFKITVYDKAMNKTEIDINEIIYGYVVRFEVEDMLYHEVVVKPGDTVVQPEEPNIPGITFFDWDTSDWIINEDRIIKAIYEIRTHTMTWMFEDEVYHVDQNVLFGDQIIPPPNVPHVQGHVFIWHIEFSRMPDHDLIITGAYVINDYIIYYYIDGILFKTQFVVYGEIIDYLVPVMEDGYTFSGWDVTYETMPDYHFDAHGTSVPNE